MYGNEQVCFGAVGNVGAFLQRNENVGLPRVDYFNVRIVSLHQAAEFQRDIEVDVLFFRNLPTAPASCPPCPASMTRVKVFPPHAATGSRSEKRASINDEIFFCILQDYIGKDSGFFLKINTEWWFWRIILLYKTTF